MQKEPIQTSYRSELREKILRVAMQEFMGKGFRTVRMDDIASLLGISKRTLYETYSNKEQLILECVRMHEEEIDGIMAAYSSDPSHNVIDIIMEFYKQQIASMTDSTPVLLSELKKYERVREYMMSIRKTRRKKAVSFFKRGVEEGYIRADVDFDIVLRIGDISIEHAMKSKMYETFSIQHLMRNIIFLFIRGMCTAEGIKKVDAANAEMFADSMRRDAQ